MNNVDSERVKVALSVGFYVLGDIRIGRACEISGKNRSEFMDILAENGIPYFRYSIEEIDKDLETLRGLENEG